MDEHDRVDWRVFPGHQNMPRQCRNIRGTVLGYLAGSESRVLALDSQPKVESLTGNVVAARILNQIECAWAFFTEN